MLKLALAQFDFPVGDLAGNGEKIRSLIAQGKAGGASLVLFPELALCGYPPEDLLLRPAFIDDCDEELERIAEATDDEIGAYLGHPESSDGVLFNAGSLLADGEVSVTYRKQELPNYAVFDEDRYFETGSDSIVGDIDGVKIALLICQDIWEDAPAADAAEAGAELLLIINASPYYVGQAESRERLLCRRARENRVAIAYVNCVGGQDDLLFDGGSMLIEPDGRVAARAPQFFEQLLFADYDNDTRRFKVDWPQPPDTSVEAVLYEGLVTGVRDYVTKNHFPGVLLGLSGGIDSALTLAIAVDALGADKVTAVMLPTRFTSDLSLREAKSQADRLGVDYHVIAIESAFETMRESLQPIFAGRAEDTTEENMQARIRGVLLMALSNKFGRMVLTTGNKSEMAVGYCTLYGDMCGGYAPLKDVYKTMVWSLSRWRNARDGVGEDAWVIPPVVIDRPPSAELRNDQTDQDSLPPYDVLDDILQRFIEKQQSDDDIIAAGFDEAVVRKVLRLVLLNEYKRRQSAPGPRVSRKAFGRDRRYPISSGWR